MKQKNKSKSKPKYNTVQNICWMIGVAWNSRKRVLLFCVLTALSEVLLNLTELYIAPEVLSRVEENASVKALLLTIGLFTAALFFINGFKKYIEKNTMFARVDVRSAIIAMLSNKSIGTSYPNTFDDNFLKIQEKAHLACDGNQQPTEHIWQTLTLLLQNMGGLIVYLTILSRLNAVLLLIVIVTCFLGFFATRYAANWRYARRDDEELYYQKKSYIRSTAESTELAKDIRIFGLQNWLNELVEQIHDLYLKFLLRCERVEVLSDIVEVILTVARNGIAYVYLINMVLKDGLSVPEFLLYFTAVTTFTTWITGILEEVSVLHKESLDISLVREFLEYPEPFNLTGGEDIPDADEFKLELKNVSFRYPGAKKDTIHNMSLTVCPNEKLAIVGLNGAGKTTLVKLLCGLLDPTKGTVLLNGKDIKDFNRKKYYNMFSAIFQDFSLLDVTLTEEIAQTTTDIDYEKINECIKKAGLASAVEKLTQGLETHIGREVYLDGVLFSGGQTQRLMLSRALYKDAPILLLDEPTAALDPIAENDIYMKYSEMTSGKTSLFISHRLASTRFCDRIIFIADGKIKEEGTHESLLALGGEYTKLFEVQSRYYKEGKEF